MPTTSPDPFANLENDFDAVLDSPKDTTAAAGSIVPLYEERCPKCRGGGRFITYTGRTKGKCFTCRGKGKLFFKTPAATRQANRERTQARKRQTGIDNGKAFAEAHPEISQWILANARTFEFAGSLFNAIKKYGHLTEKQMAAAQKCVTRESAEQTEREARQANAVEIDISAISTAFNTAHERGRRTPKITLNGYKFKRAPDHGRNPGAIYVTQDDQWLGTIKDNAFASTRECTPSQQTEIIAAAADPDGAMTRFGLETGHCGICNRELTDPKSRARGIGPVCAENFGW